jgi:3-hydroxybutyryl-CoA dehydrogenase
MRHELRNGARHLPDGNLGVFTRSREVPVEIKRVGIVGSGIMGAGVAEVAARTGFEVVLRSRSQRGAESLVAGLEKSLAKQVEKGKLDDDERTAVLGRLRTVTDVGELSECDLVLESIVEDLALKTQLFGELDTVCGDGTILATNTSTLSVKAIAAATGRPQQVCGIHFFNPATVMPLVELVRAEQTSDETLAAARAFVESCGKTVVDVRDQAGFVVNALLFPYLNNAVKWLDAGVASRDDIDTAMKGGCNFPMGPLELLDLVGLDTSLAIIEALHAEFDDPNYEPAPLLRRLVEEGKLGRKSGAGFYDYAKR